MASLNMFLAPATAITTSSSSTTTTSITTNTISIATTRTRSVRTLATTKGGSNGSSEENGFLAWLSVALQKDSFVETDPLLQKVEGKTTTSNARTTVSGKKSMAGPAKKSDGDNGGGFAGFGGLFSKK